jgi:glycosyltransferase involved in cell wall biosynthesis
MDGAIERAMDVFHDISYLRRRHWQRPVEKTVFSGDHFKETEHIKSTLVFGNLSRQPAPITVVIPTFDRVDYLEECLKSVLNQTVPSNEYDVLVVDNEPVENSETEKLMKRYQVPNIYYYRNQKNLGTYSNFNRCFQLARSKWVCMVHDDDLLVPTCIASVKQVLWKLRKKNIGYVMSGRIDVSVDDPHYLPDYWDMTNLGWLKRFYMWLRIVNNRRIWKIFLHDVFLIRHMHLSPSCGILFNRDAVMAMGGFAKEYSIDDSHFLIALGEKYDCYYCGGIWGKYRFGTNNGWMKDCITNTTGDYMLREFAATYNKRCGFYSKKFRNILHENNIDFFIAYVKFRDNGYTLTRELFPYSESVASKKIQYVRKVGNEFDKKMVALYSECWRFWIVLRTAIFGIRYHPLPGEDIETYIRIAKRRAKIQSELSSLPNEDKK